MRSIFCIVIAWLFTATCFSQVTRALVIGIDIYSPPQGKAVPVNNDRQIFPNLNGCKNDAIAISSVLQTHFAVSQKNIDTLYNRTATRENILGKLKLLLDNCQQNDLVFIFYAGHGSQVNNSLSSEPDRKDETIVPSDAWTRPGMDITDKELARIFNQFIDKRIKLVVVFDCCHSGSMSRAPVFDMPVSRYIKGSLFDSKDPEGFTAPEQRRDGDFIILSASQDNESAVEQYDGNGIPHGAFTNAFLQSVYQQGANASVSNLFLATRAILKANGKKQEPVLAGSQKWLYRTLLNGEIQQSANAVLIPAIGNNKEYIEIGAGYAQELNAGNELICVLPGNDTVLLRIDTVLSITNSWASVIKGDKSKIKSGQLFEISNWISRQTPLLSVYFPDHSYSEIDIQKITAIGRSLKKQLPNQFVNDLSDSDPEMSFFFVKGQCWMNNAGRQLVLVKKTDPASLMKIIGKKTFYFDIPLAEKFKNALKNRLSKNANIQLVTNSTEAQYVLFGSLNKNQQVAYGWRRTQATAKDSLENMPVQTRSFGLTEQTDISFTLNSDSLAQMAARLSKVRAWLQLTGPKTTDPFPYHLELRHKGSDAIIDTMPFRVDDEVTLYLVEEYGALKTPKRKYVYSFIIDRDGTMTLLYPNPLKGNVENRFPQINANSRKENVELINFSIGIPTGTDTYFLLATDEPIQQYALLFNQMGTRSVNLTEEANPLRDLINLGNEQKTRSLSKTPKNWTLSKLSIKTIY